jgi:histidine triad (HIT) family protein
VSIDPSCLFCRIANGESPGYLVYEDDRLVGFLDHRPLRPGHCLVVPRYHVETLYDAAPDLLGQLMLVVQRLAAAAERAMHAEGSFVAINVRVSQSVPHLHAHVVPRNRKDGLFARNFVWMRRPYPNQDAILSTQAAIRSALGPS